MNTTQEALRFKTLLDLTKSFDEFNDITIPDGADVWAFVTDYLTLRFRLALLYWKSPIKALWVECEFWESLFLDTPLWIRVVSICMIMCTLWRAKNAAVLAHRDMGKGGTPPTTMGWFRLWRLRFFGQINSVFEAPHIDPYLKPYRGCLHQTNLGQRKGLRPQIGGTAPQRQLNQKATNRDTDLLHHRMKFRAETYGLDLIYEKSYLEAASGSTMAIKVRKQSHEYIPAHANPQTGVMVEAVEGWTTETPYVSHPKRGWIKKFGYEIAHVHHADGSLHVILHPEDIQVVVDAGWGERHPLTTTNWLWLFYYNQLKPTFYENARVPIPEHLVFVYAPRDQDELMILMTIVDAAIWHATGEEAGLVVGNATRFKDHYDDEVAQGQPSTEMEEGTSEEGDRREMALGAALREEARVERENAARAAMRAANPNVRSRRGSRVGPTGTAAGPHGAPLIELV